MTPTATRLSYPPALLRHGEAAEYLGVSPRTLDAWQARGLLAPKDVDGMKRWLGEDLDEFARTRPNWESKR